MIGDCQQGLFAPSPFIGGGAFAAELANGRMKRPADFLDAGRGQMSTTVFKRSTAAWRTAAESEIGLFSGVEMVTAVRSSPSPLNLCSQALETGPRRVRRSAARRRRNPSS